MTSPSDRTTPEAPPAPDDAAESTRQTIHRLQALLAELKDYAAYYAAARVDKVKWSLTKVGVYAAAGVVGFLVLAALLATTVVLFLVGAATALGQAFGPDRWWLGWLVVGGAILLVAGIGLAAGIRAFLRRSGKSLVQRYEAKREAQRAKHGHHVRSRAADSSQSV